MGEEEAIEELPMTTVRLVVEDMLVLCPNEINVSLHKDALLTFSEAGRVFIHHLSAIANEICMESKRKTINAEDVMIAIEIIEFDEFLGPLRDSLEDYRRKNPKKRTGTAKAKKVSKKRKDDVPLPPAPQNKTHAADVVKECNNSNNTACYQELQHNSDEEDVDREGEEDVDDQQQNAAVEEEKSSKDATDDEQNDEDNVSNTTRNHEPDADQAITRKDDDLNPAEEE